MSTYLPITGLFALLGLAGAGCGSEKEVQVVHIYHYADAGSGPEYPGELPPRGGFTEGEGQGEGGGGGGERPSERSDAGPRSDAGSVRDHDAGVSGSGADAGSGVGDGESPRIEYYGVEQLFGDPREASALIYDASPVDVDFVLTNTLGLEELVTVSFEQVQQRGREAELGGTEGIYRANFGNVWDQPGRYKLKISAHDRAGNERTSFHDLFVLDRLVVLMERFLNDAPVYTLSYADWEAKIVDSPLFREMFNREAGSGTHADVVLDYETTLGRRVVGDRAYQKDPVQVHLVRSQDERGTLAPVYEFFYDNDAGFHTNMAGFVYERIDVRATGALVDEALRSER